MHQLDFNKEILIPRMHGANIEKSRNVLRITVIWWRKTILIDGLYPILCILFNIIPPSGLSFSKWSLLFRSPPPRGPCMHISSPHINATSPPPLPNFSLCNKPEEILENTKKRKNQKCNYKTTNWTRGNNYKRNWTEPAYMVRPCSENGRKKITQNSTEVNAETKENKR